MAKTRYILTVVIGITFLAFFSCREKGTEPPTGPQPGKRDYVWTVDTLRANPGDLFYLFSLWGSCPTDIWAVGSGSSSAVTLWHYDGTNWSRNNSRLSSNLMSIYGFAKNDVYACDAPGRGVYHYDGQQWSNVYNYNGSGTYLGLNSVWGNASNNIYAVGDIDTIGIGGYKGAILHYDGGSWTFLSIPNYRVGFVSIRRGSNESDKYYLMATRFESVGDTNKIFEYDGNIFKEIYSGQLTASVNEIAGNAYICIGKIIYKNQNDQLVVWKDFSTTKHLGRVWGRSEIDFFTVASDGLTHFNGTDLVTLYPTDLFINDVFVFTKDIFVLCNNRMIIHGTLK